MPKISSFQNWLVTGASRQAFVLLPVWAKFKKIFEREAKL
jgi:hypothetical protein